MVATIVYLAIHNTEPSEAWARFGVPYMGATYADLYVFPAAQQTLAANGDIYARMDSDPWQRSFNYPVLWLTFMRFSAAQIPMLGSAMAGIWIVALFAVVGRLDSRQGLATGLLACSPATILALERGNSDLLIFILVSAGLILLRHGRTIPAWTAMTAAAVLKLFPLFAIGSVLRLGWRRAAPWILASIVGVSLLCLLQLDEIRGVLRETPQGGVISYGSTGWINVANLLFREATGRGGVFDAYRPPVMLCGGVLAVVVFLAGIRQPGPRAENSHGDSSLDAFRAGAGMFLATFLLGNHFAYRLILLLLCIPWLARRDHGVDSAVARARELALGCAALVLWLNPLWQLELYYLREVAFWVLMPTMAWLLGRTLPVAELPGVVQRWLHPSSPTVS